MKKVEGKTVRKCLLNGLFGILSIVFSVFLAFFAGPILDSDDPTPVLHDGKIDFKDASNCQVFSLGGGASFYPGEWIVSEPTWSRTPPESIQLPGSFTLEEPIASLKWNLINLPDSFSLHIHQGQIGLNYRLFLDGVLFYEYGDLEQSILPNFALGDDMEKVSKTAYAHEDSSLVMEFAAPEHDISIMPSLSTGIYRSRGDSIRKAVAFFILGIGVSMVIISLLFWIFSTNPWQNALLFISLLLALASFLFSSDGVGLFHAMGVDIHPYFAWGLHGGFYGLCSLFGLLFITMDQMQKSRHQLYVHLVSSSLVLGASILGFFPSSKISILWFALLFFAGTGMELALHLMEKRTYGVVFASTLIGIKIAHIHLGEGIFPSYRIGAISLLYIFFLTTTFYYFAAHYQYLTQSEATLELEEAKYRHQKELSLREEIKPHFVFNALSAIESSYSHSLQEGDEAVHKFASIARQGILNVENDLIPLEEEMSHINQYLELENLRFPSRPYSILFDIEDEEILIPPLGIETFVENIVVHSHANKKGPAEIEITEEEKEDGIHIQIKDEGIGFNEEENRPGIGLSNTMERWELLLGAHVEIHSALGEGTRIEIHIPHKEGA